MNRIARIAIVWLSWTVMPPLHATEIYRWVDAEGVVHYTETPPPGQPAEPMKLRVPQTGPDPDSATAGLKRYQDAQDKGALEQQAAAAKAAEQRRQDEERRAQCAAARDIVTRLQTRPAARYQREDGSYQLYSDEEREQRVSEAREYERQHCD